MAKQSVLDGWLGKKSNSTVHEKDLIILDDNSDNYSAETSSTTSQILVIYMIITFIYTNKRKFRYQVRKF